MRGHYIAFEGVEGAGKSTVVKAVAARLQAAGENVLLVREPGGTAAGEQLRDILLHDEVRLEPWTEAMLFAAARAQLAREVLDPALEEGRWVVSDRSVYSSLAYQGWGRGLGEDEVRGLNSLGLEDTWPELVILLRLPPAEGLARQAVADKIGAEGLAFQERVSLAFDTLAAAEPERFVVVDATAPVDDLVEGIWQQLSRRWRIPSEA